MTSRYAIAALAASLFAVPALAQDHAAVVGDWDTITETPMGDFAAGITVEHGADGYSVMIEDRPPEGAAAMPPMESTISNIAVDGDTVTFVRSLSTPQGPMELTYTLTADGNALAGEANSVFGAVPISGTRTAAQ